MFKLLMVVVVSLGAGFSSFAKEGKGHQQEGEKYSPYTFDRAMATPPAAPVLNEPAPLSTVSQEAVTLKWQPVETASHYHVQVATDPTFKWLVQNEYFFKGTSFELKGLEKGKSYYWRVSAVKPENNETYTKSTFARSSFETSK